MKNRGLKRLVGAVLACVMIGGCVPFGVLDTAKAVYAAEPMSDADLIEVNIASDNNSLFESFLKKDGNYKITLYADVTRRLGTQGNIDSPYVKDWVTLGTGTKVIDLNGHDISLYNDRVRPDSEKEHMYMFKVPEGAKAVINDIKNEGTIHYDGLLKDNKPYCRSHYLEQRGIFDVYGGELTINGGNIIAGRVNKSGNGAVGYHWKQINGNAVTLANHAKLTVNGGTLAGRGFGVYSSIKDAAIQANTYSTVYINDGKFWGNGGADVLKIFDTAECYIKAGYFNTTKQDCIIWYDDANPGFYDSGYGNIGIPVSTASQYGSNTAYYKSGEEMSADELKDADNITYTSSRIEAKPRNTSTYIAWAKDGGFNTEKRHLSLEWDKVTHLKFSLMPSEFYFFNMKFYDKIPYYSYYTTYTVSTSQNGAAVDPLLENVAMPASRAYTGKRVPDAVPYAKDCYFDLSELSEEARSKLQVGKTYYLQIKTTEVYEGQNTYTRTYKPVGDVKIKITEDTATMPEFNFGVSYTLDTSSEPNSITLKPTGAASALYFDTLITQGKITKWKAYWKYFNKNKEEITEYLDPSNNRDLHLTKTDYRAGISSMSFGVMMYYGDRLLGVHQESGAAVFLPNIVTEPAAVNGSVIVKPGTAVTISNDGDRADGIFYQRDDTKVSADSLSYTITDVGAKSGVYRVGYSFNGQDHLSDRGVYIGVIDTGDRYLNLTASSTTCTITSDDDPTPTLTATATGSEWGAMSRYSWYIESVPSDLADSGLTVPQKINVSSSEMSTAKTLGQLFGTDGGSTLLTAGDYVIRCEATNTAGQKVSSQPVTITVKRPPLDMKLIWKGKDITGGGIVVNPNETAEITPELTPERSSFGTGMTYAAVDNNIAEVSADGIVTPKSCGKTSVIAICGNGNISKSFDVYVPRTEYSLDIPEEYLKPEAGVAPGTVALGAGDGFTAELKWAYSGGFYDGNILAEDEAFRGNFKYKPIVEIYPDKGTAYPADYLQTYYKMYTYKQGEINVTVNGNTYYGEAQICQANYYTYDLPVSKGNKTYDRIELKMEPADIVIDPKDVYMDEADIKFDLPDAGYSPAYVDACYLKDNVKFDTDNLCVVTDDIKEVTDIRTITDKDTDNDSVENFGGTFEAGKIYRYYMYVGIDLNAKTEAGGRFYFADAVRANVSQEDGQALKNIVDTDDISVRVYVYFRANPNTGDINADGSINDLDAKLLLKYLSGTEQLNAGQYETAKCTDDDDVDMLDAIWILNNPK